MDTLRRFLSTTESHFNWNLDEVEVTKHKSITDRFEDKLRYAVMYETPVNVWPLKLSYGFELLPENENRAHDVIKEAVTELLNGEDPFFRKYQVPFQHIALALLAFVLVKTDGDLEEMKGLVSKIKPIGDMSNKERAAVLGMKSNILRLYGPDGTARGLSMIKEAIRLNPEEPEWLFSLAITQSRMRHFTRCTTHTWTDIPESIEILEKLIESPNVSSDMKTNCKYFLAQAYKDLIITRRDSNNIYLYNEKIIQNLCNEIYHSNNGNPQIISFCAQQFSRAKNYEMATATIEKALEKFPRHVGVNTEASNLFKTKNCLDLALKHAKIAMDEGGYGAAFVVLECSVKLGKPLIYEWFFDTLLAKHPVTFKAQTHVQAAQFYFFQEHDAIKGADHVGQALKIDPSYKGLEESWCYWIHRYVKPLEEAYNQIIINLERGQCSDEEEKRLLEVKVAIETHTSRRNNLTNTQNQKERRIPI